MFSGEVGSGGVRESDESYNFDNTPRGVGVFDSESASSSSESKGRFRKGSEHVPVLVKKGVAKARETPTLSTAGPPPPPPPKGWASAVDPQGRTYYWNQQTGQTCWKIENCK